MLIYQLQLMMRFLSNAFCVRWPVLPVTAELPCRSHACFIQGQLHGHLNEHGNHTIMRFINPRQKVCMSQTSPFSGGDIRYMNARGFQQAQLARKKAAWDDLLGLHICSCNTPLARAKLCTCLPGPIACLWSPTMSWPCQNPNSGPSFISWVGCHSVPSEQGRLVRPHVPRQLRRCTLCTTCALGNEHHYVFICPHFAGLRLTHGELFQDASGAMMSLVWHKDQQAVCALLLATVAEAQT